MTDQSIDLLHNVVVTGAAGFIGAAVCRRLIDSGATVTGIDNVNDYYDVGLKRSRLALLEESSGRRDGETSDHRQAGVFHFHEVDIADSAALTRIVRQSGATTMIHLAAQAGVRYSIDHPQAYVQSNLVGFGNILEVCRELAVHHLVFASTSSVYGLNTQMPFSEHHGANHPVSLYAATKKSNELMAHAYAHLYEVPVTALRFFTVYGPWMRPDMALYKFAMLMANDEPIEIYNQGEMVRDFTYIDDIVTGIINSATAVPVSDPAWDSQQPDPATSQAPYRVFNIGNGKPVPLLTYVDLLEQALGVKAKRHFLPMQDGDVAGTYADISELHAATGYSPQVSVEQGVQRFAAWFKDYHQV